MGLQFGIGHANFVAYLTAGEQAVAPRTDRETLGGFLDSLVGENFLISSSKGTRDDWTHEVSNAANSGRQTLRKQGKQNRGDILTSAQVRGVLNPLRKYFNDYILYAMVLSRGWGDNRETFGFYHEAAMSSHGKGLVLMPDVNDPTQLLQIVDPFPALRALAENPITPPAVVFWTPLKNVCVLALDEAFAFFRNDLRAGLEGGVEHIDGLLRNVMQRKRCKRILHLSDLHFGTRESQRRRTWLKEQLTSTLTNIDRVVVTGDLFDNPKRPLRESFDEFRFDVENLTKKDLLVIPGNHDVRRQGNAIGSFFRNPEYITDLRWNPVVFDDEIQAVFFKRIGWRTVAKFTRRKFRKACLYSRPESTWDEELQVGYALCQHCDRRGVHNGHASFTASKLFSPFLSVVDLVRNWMDSKDDPEAKQTFHNIMLGQAFRADISRDILII